ncbi:MAG: AAA family ATPase, partial [archaeon]
MTAKNIFEKELNKKSIFIDRNAISPHYLPKRLPFRQKQIKEISKIMAVSLRNKKPDNLFVYGKVGSGKTSVLKHVMSELTDYAVKNNVKVKNVYINCRNHNSKYKVLIKAVKELFPEQSFLGFSAAFVYEKLMEFASQGNELMLVLDEIDRVKELDDLVYALSRANDELEKGSITVMGISNNLLFKERLDARTKSSLCEQELVFPPYNAEELREILSERTTIAFKKGSVKQSAINLAAAIAAQESGDARTAVTLLLRAGEIAEKNGLTSVRDEEVKKAKEKVEREVTINMISTLPTQQQLVLYAIASLSVNRKGIKTITGLGEEGVLYSGETFEEYTKLCKQLKENPVSTRWFREYVNELEVYGLVTTTHSGKGIRGTTTLIKLGF